MNSKPDSAFFYGQKLYAEAVRVNDSGLLAKACFYMGNAFAGLYNYDSAAIFQLRATKIGTLLKDTAFLLLSHYALALDYYHRGFPKKAEAEFQKGLSFAIASNDSVTIAKYYISLGTINRDYHEINKATEYLVKSLTLSEKIGFDTVIAIASRDLGILANESGNFAMAMHHLRLSLSKFIEMNDSLGIGEIYVEYGMYHYAKNLDSSKYYFTRALQIFKALRNEEMQLVVNFNLACMVFDNGNNAEARNIFLHTYQESIRRNDIEGQSKSLLMLISVANKMRDWNEAARYINLAELLQKEYDHPDFHQELLKEKIYFSKMKQTPGQTIKLLETYIVFKDSLAKEERRDIVESVQQQFDYEKNTYEIAFLEQQAKIQESKATFKNTLIISMSAFLLIAFFLIGIIIIYFRKNLKIQRQLAESEKQLRYSNMSKDKLFSIIAHDLRAPFQNIFGYTDVLTEEMDKMEAGEIKRFIGIIGNSSKQAFNLLDNLLQWSLTQRRGIQYEPVELDISRCIENIIKLIEPQVKKKQISIVYSQGGPIIGMADENMLNTILRNLLSNAVKFTRQNGRVEITTRLEHNYHKILIRDNGTGISKERLEKIFELTALESMPGTAKEKGSGLGLILCREFVEMHGGQINIESAIGEGTTVEFSIPAAG